MTSRSRRTTSRESTGASTNAPDSPESKPGPPNWWEAFFSGLVVDFWRVALPEEFTRKQTEFLWRQLRLREGSRVLDAPCGDGRLALPLSRRGADVTGIDSSAEFLEAARASARNAGLAARFELRDMRDLPADGSFDAVFCFGNSFGYMDDAANAEFLSAVGRALARDGRFALDYGQVPECVFPRIVPRSEADFGDMHFVEETRYDFLSGRIENRFTISRGSRSETKEASQRAYTIRELHDLLGAAGLKVTALYGSPEETAFDFGAGTALIVAERR